MRSRLPSASQSARTPPPWRGTRAAAALRIACSRCSREGSAAASRAGFEGTGGREHPKELPAQH